MIDDVNIERIVKNNIFNPAIVVDAAGKIIELNEASLKLLPGAQSGGIIYDLFEEDASNAIEKLILEAKTYDKVIEEELSYGLPKSKGKLFRFVITPLKNKNSKEFFVSIQVKDKKDVQKTPDRFSIHIGDISTIIDDTKILELIEQIKKDFPFTFIAKKKIRKALDELDEGIWIKDANREYLLANAKFAHMLNSNVNKLEGANEGEFIPKSMNEMFIAVESYIKETGRAVVIDIPGFVGAPNENISVIQLPLSDIDDNVVAFVGITQTNEIDRSDLRKHYYYYHETVYNFSEPLFVIDKNDKIVTCSKKAAELFGIEDAQSVNKYTVEKIFGNTFLKKIQSNFESKENFGEFQFPFEFENDLGLTDVLIHKIQKNGEEFSGYYISIYKKDETQTQTEMKAKMYDIIMHTSPEAIFVYEIENLKFLDVNESALRLYGYTRDEFLQMDLTDLYAPEDIQTLIESSARKTITSAFTGPWRHKRKDNISILVELSKITLDYKGKRAHLNIVRDITEKLDSDKKMQLFRASFEKTNDLIIITDKDGFIIFSNKRVREVLGYTDEELDKKSFLSLVSDEDRSVVNSNIFNSESHDSTTLEIKLKKNINEEVNAKLNSTPILEYNQQVDSFNLTITVMEKPKEIIHTVVHKEPPIQQPLDAEFLSNLFHEILTPINVIVGFVQELTESIAQPSDDQKEASQIISENQKLLLQIMDTAVEYSHIELGKVQLQAEKLIFVELIDEIQNSIKKIAEAKNQELTYGKISSSLAFVSDKQKFISLISLLLRFAFKITEQKKIFLSAYARNNDEFMISIKDNRAAISNKLMTELKDVFTLDESKVKQSTGISRFTIRLTRKLAELLNVKVEIIEKGNEPIEYALIFPVVLDAEFKHTETPVRGTRSSQADVELPKEKKLQVPVKREVQPVAEDEPKKIIKKNVEEVAYEPMPVKRKEVNIETAKLQMDYSEMKCLYIEDQVDSQILFKMQMKSIKAIDFAMTFEKALPLIKKKEYDFIIIDINLPGQYNGLDALRIIRTLPGYKTTPLIAVSAYVLPGDRLKFIEAGFNDFIAKPIMQVKVFETLERVFI
ncbi:MAG: PAS domain S-box protein [bacterium]